MTLQPGDLIKFRIAGEERFGIFLHMERGGIAVLGLGRGVVAARVKLVDIIENRSQDDPRYQSWRNQ